MAEYDRNSELRAFDDTKAGVKGLVDAGVAKVPRMFVHQEYILEEKIPQPELSVPVIDLGCLDRGAIIQQLKAASQDWGFFKIVNHGIPTSLMNKVVEVVKEFSGGEEAVLHARFQEEGGLQQQFRFVCSSLCQLEGYSVFGHGSQPSPTS